MRIDRGGDCPQCTATLVRVGGGLPWCPDCEWNLGTYDPDLRPPRGWRSLERRGHRMSYRLDRDQLRRFAAEPPQRPGWTRARIALTTIAVLLIVGTLVALAFGVLLLVQHETFVRVLVGVVLIVLAFAFRPRLGRGPRRRNRLDPEAAPDLFNLLADIARAVGTTPPDHVVVDSSFNAALGQTGLRRQTTLYLGMSLWSILDPPCRVALLAHEFGHAVNHDANRGVLVQPALEAFGRLAEWTGADRTFAYLMRPESPRIAVLPEFLLYLLSRIFLIIHIGLSALGMRDHQRAEIVADGLAVRVGGTAASARLMRLLAVSDQVWRTIAYAAETSPPREWRRLVDNLLRSRHADLPVYAQLSMRRTSLWDTHPPSGLRWSLVSHWPRQEPSPIAERTDWDRIDRSLAAYYARMHRRVPGHRDYRPAASAG